MREFKLYDKVRLSNGLIAFIVEIYNNGEAYEADIDTPDGTVTDTVLATDIMGFA